MDRHTVYASWNHFIGSTILYMRCPFSNIMINYNRDQKYIQKPDELVSCAPWLKNESKSPDNASSLAEKQPS